MIIFNEPLALELRRRKDAVRDGLTDERQRDDALCREQVSQHHQGYREAQLVKSIYGWGVRAGSGLEEFRLLAATRYGNVDGSAASALRWAKQWMDTDPYHRYVTTHSSDEAEIQTALRQLDRVS